MREFNGVLESQVIGLEEQTFADLLVEASSYETIAEVLELDACKLARDCQASKLCHEGRDVLAA